MRHVKQVDENLLIVVWCKNFSTEILVFIFRTCVPRLIVLIKWITRMTLGDFDVIIIQYGFESTKQYLMIKFSTNMKWHKHLSNKITSPCNWIDTNAQRVVQIICHDVHFTKMWSINHGNVIKTNEEKSTTQNFFILSLHNEWFFFWQKRTNKWMNNIRVNCSPKNDWIYPKEKFVQICYIGFVIIVITTPPLRTQSVPAHVKVCVSIKIVHAAKVISFVGIRTENSIYDS